MINTDMIVGRLQQGVALIEDRFAEGLETPKLDVQLGGADQLTHKQGYMENGTTYLKFRRSFASKDLDGKDFQFTSSMDSVTVVYAYSSVATTSLVYHGPTRGYGKLPWNLNCSSNFFFNLQTSQCEGCDRGLYRIASDPSFQLIRCERCPWGTFADERGEDRTSSQCNSCGFSHSTTLYPGASSQAECVCEAGYYHPCSGDDCKLSTHTVEKVGALSAAGQEFCQPCPRSMLCPGGAASMDGGSKEDASTGNLMHEQPELRAGYYSTLAAPYEIYECLPRELCPGGKPATCANGRVGELCAHCPVDQSPDGFGCKPCSDSVKSFSSYIFWLGAIPVVIFCYYALNSKQSAKASTLFCVATASGMLLGILQVLGIASLLNVDWPPEFRPFLDMAQIFVLDMEFLDLRCGAGREDTAHYIIRSFPFVALPVVLWCCFGGSLILSKVHPKFKMWNWWLVVNTTGQFFQMLFTMIIGLALFPFTCYSHPNGKSSIAQYPAVMCGSESHVVLMIIGAILTLMAGIFFAIAVYGVYRAPLWAFQGAHQKLMMIKHLIGRFQPDAWYWGICLLARSLALSLVPVIAPSDGLTQLILINILFTVVVVLQAAKWPWRTHTLNVVDALISVVMTAVMVVSAAFLKPIEKEESFGYSVVLVLLISLLYFVVLMVLLEAFFAIWRSGPLGSYKDKSIFSSSSQTPEVVAKNWCELTQQMEPLGSEDVRRAMEEMTIIDIELVAKAVYILSHGSFVGSSSLSDSVISKRRSSRVNTFISNSSGAVLSSMEPKQEEQEEEQQEEQNEGHKQEEQEEEQQEQIVAI